MHECSTGNFCEKLFRVGVVPCQLSQPDQKCSAGSFIWMWEFYGTCVLNWTWVFIREDTVFGITDLSLHLLEVELIVISLSL